MLQRLKHYALIAAAGFLLWGIMANHFIFEGHHIHLLRKTKLDLHETFVSLHNKKPAALLKNDRLREAGIGDLLVDLGMLTEDEKYSLESKYQYGE
jgi:hypothetical protein